MAGVIDRSTPQETVGQSVFKGYLETVGWFTESTL